MSYWQRTLDLGDVYHSGISLNELAGIIATRLADLKDFDIQGIDEWKAEIIDEFKELGKFVDLDFGEFNDAMERLYNWADTSLESRKPLSGKKVCWVRTQPGL